MICPNCGRRNPSGATFCSRCRQRLPLATRYTGQRRTILAEPSGGGGGGALVLGVALLAGFLFIGGGAAIYLSQPQAVAPTDVAVVPSAGRSLDVFVQETPTPLPTPVPTATPLPTIDPFASPTFDPFASPTFDPFASPTIDPFATPTANPTATPLVTEARWSWEQRQGLRVAFNDNSRGIISAWLWDFGDGSTSSEASPRHDYTIPGKYTVVLTVNGPTGTATRAREIRVVAPATPTPTASPTGTPGPTAIAVRLTCNWNDNEYTASCEVEPNGLSYEWRVPPDTGELISSNDNKAQFHFIEPDPGTSYETRVRVVVTDGNATGRARTDWHTFSKGPEPTDGGETAE